MTSILDNVPFVGTQRNELRKLARNHPGFDKWRAINDPTNAMHRANIIKAISDLGLEAEAAKIISAPQVNGIWHCPDCGKANLSEEKACFDCRGEEGEDGEGDAGEDAMTLEGAPAGIDDESSVESSPIESDIESVLGPVKPFLAAGLVATMESALRPIVIAAHKAPQVIVQAAPVILRNGEAPHGTRIGQTTMAKAFMVGGVKGKKPVALWNDPLAPKKDAGYVMDGAAMYLAASAFEAGETVWFAGPAGAGKTTRAKEYAAITGRGFVRIGFNHSTEMIDLIGQPEPVPANENGGVKMVWRDGVFTRAIRRAGTVILLDELTGSPPGTSMTFQTILDERQLTLPTGEVVNFADGVVVVIADNTAGYGDELGVYAGTQAANGALVDRSARLIPVDYMSAMLEAEALERRTGAPRDACIRLADFAAKVRTIQAQAGSDSRPFSIRRLIAFANATHRDLLSADEAWQITTLSRLPEADRESMRQAINAHFDDRAFVRELKNEPAPVEPVQSELVGMNQASRILTAAEERRQAEAKRAFSMINPA